MPDLQSGDSTGAFGVPTRFEQCRWMQDGLADQCAAAAANRIWGYESRMNHGVHLH